MKRKNRRVTNMDLEKIEKLVNIIEKSSMLEFSIQEGETKIKMSRRGSAGVPGEPLLTAAGVR